jgi:uncharacterized protein (TIGR02246 family)
MRTLKFLLLTFGIVVWALPSFSSGLSPEDTDTVKEANLAAWLANDAEAVMATLTEDAVLLPHHGVAPVVGAEAIRRFWFPPDSPPAKVTHMVNSVTEVDGSGDMAIVWGLAELEFTYEGKTYRNNGNYLSVLRRGDDGRWRIARRIWNDPMPEVE